MGTMRLGHKIALLRCTLDQFCVFPAHTINRGGRKVGYRQEGPVNSVFTGTGIQLGHLCNPVRRGRISKSSVEA